MKFSVFQTSHQGGRKKNEDRMGYCHTGDAALFVLADGMGGHPEGETAAQIAIQTMAALFKKQALPTIDDVPHFLESGLLMAHRQILRYAIDKGMPDSPRTTLVAAVVQNGEIQWIHCGDSRLYITRKGVLLTRTRDHSYSELRESVLTKMGEMNRNVLFTCLGSPARPIYDLSSPENLDKDDRILLCSDGLWGPLDEDSIVNKLNGGDITLTGPELVELAFHTAGKSSDNITIIAVDWQEERKQTASRAVEINDDFSDMEEFTTTISGDLLDDVDIEKSLSEINRALRRS
ncbi:serine/threonine protein phosphatase [Vandammella animalimorsus]|uniref:Serine/threonine protein phosphatase n=1 Tax=Vandammella animalimorsus TaxID=2029117 RepID=A0A2A2T8Q3_9BURK|nr:PP2C family serine/threonine-protein phosphatase [Vandammella animalimorsus]PAT33340.1 serine/threonine protein phosphatase [Vandammella animalimorsus]PAX18420.1 serine/threonine protein phosphatase [Vandammella animalimorsus]PAX20584.1 serine/threonine protein phosphatase [Vandammella animalimorsus]